MVCSLLFNFECLGSSPSWILRQWSMCCHCSLLRTQALIPRLMT